MKNWYNQNVRKIHNWEIWYYDREKSDKVWFDCRHIVCGFSASRTYGYKLFGYSLQLIPGQIFCEQHNRFAYFYGRFRHSVIFDVHKKTWYFAVYRFRRLGACSDCKCCVICRIGLALVARTFSIHIRGACFTGASYAVFTVT